MKTYYDSLSISKAEKTHYLKKYKNPEIFICANPHNVSQKTVYIEYDKNWWGSFYFAVVQNNKILKWIQIKTYGAIVRHVRWNDEKNFFYEDSTHMGTRTHNTCRIQDSSVNCEKPKILQF